MAFQEHVLMVDNLVLVLLFLSSASVSQVAYGLTKGSALSVGNPEDVLVSSNGLFTAGFHSVGINAFVFAIWFTEKLNLQLLTIVWMANRDHPVNGKSSKLSLLIDGNLVLTDADQITAWATNTASSSSVQLLLQNNGNLVLTDGENILWQSFEYPTDTLLPGQTLTRCTTLVSSRSQSNYSSGFYKLFFDNDNVLRLLFDGPETSSYYWPDPWLLSNQAGRSRYNDTRIAVLDSWGHFQSSDRLKFSSDDYGPGIHRRLTLDFDGNLRLYSLDRNSGRWIASWQAMFTTCRIQGICGPNSFCIHDLDKGTRCLCPQGYRMKNNTDWSYGCLPKFEFPCNSNKERFLKLPHTNFYGYNQGIMRNITLGKCEKLCLESCDCKGFHYRFSVENGAYSCYLKRELRNGFILPTERGVLYLKLPEAFVSSHEQLPETFSLNCSNNRIEVLNITYWTRSESGLERILLWFAPALGAVEFICIFSVWLYLSRSNRALSKQQYIPLATKFRHFSFSELMEATNNFNREIGRGSSGTVYKGVLSDQRVAAIKRLSEANQEEAEFLAELRVIGRINHMNLIEMWGYCAEGKHQLVVYEYLEHGSLAENLRCNAIDWRKRFEIAVGIAKGLAYLHEECSEWVLHCDVKPENILLDATYQPKVADFGLCKLMKRAGNDPKFSKMRGTRGYMAPEWIGHQPITSKVDVYSYGVVVLEMVTGSGPTIGIQRGQQRTEKGLMEWVSETVKGGGRGTHNHRTPSPSPSPWIEELVDPLMHATCSCSWDRRKMELLVTVALKCIQEDKDVRPTMKQVVEMLITPP